MRCAAKERDTVLSGEVSLNKSKETGEEAPVVRQRRGRWLGLGWECRQVGRLWRHL